MVYSSSGAYSYYLFRHIRQQHDDIMCMQTHIHNEFVPTRDSRLPASVAVVHGILCTNFVLVGDIWSGCVRNECSRHTNDSISTRNVIVVAAVAERESAASTICPRCLR